MERARRLRAQEFQGNLDPSVADDWFQVMNGVFEVMQYSDEQKLSIATFMLGGKAMIGGEPLKLDSLEG